MIRKVIIFLKSLRKEVDGISIFRLLLVCFGGQLAERGPFCSFFRLLHDLSFGAP